MTRRTITISVTINATLLNQFDAQLMVRGMKRSSWIAAKMREQLEQWEK